jgi:hypothetical protein
LRERNNGKKFYKFPAYYNNVILEKGCRSIGSIWRKLKSYHIKGKGKAVALEAWSGPEGSRKLRFPDFMTTAQDGGKVVSLTHRPPLPLRKYTWYSFLLEAESNPGP